MTNAPRPTKSPSTARCSRTSRRAPRRRSSSASPSSSSSSASRASRSCGGSSCRSSAASSATIATRCSAVSLRRASLRRADAGASRGSRRPAPDRTPTGRRRGPRSRPRGGRHDQAVRAEFARPRREPMCPGPRPGQLTLADAELLDQSRPPQVDHREPIGLDPPQPPTLVGRVDRPARRGPPFGPGRRRLERRVQRPRLAGPVVSAPRRRGKVRWSGRRVEAGLAMRHPLKRLTGFRRNPRRHRTRLPPGPRRSHRRRGARPVAPSAGGRSGPPARRAWRHRSCRGQEGRGSPGAHRCGRDSATAAPARSAIVPRCGRWRPSRAR